ncbi:MAG TPA: ComF family protein [Clostridia bacterium]|nr:ComF family protein [Clostridia bacterium]
MSKWGEAILNLLFPETKFCCICQRENKNMQSLQLCFECAQKILEISETIQTCPHCGFFTGGASCPTCGSWSESLKVSTVVPYEGIFRDLILNFKFNGQQTLAEPLGFLMASRLRRLGLVEKIAGVVPVPLSESREKERGFNQSLLLAEVIAEELGKPLWTVLTRKHFQAPQSSLNRRERLKNITGAFQYSPTRKIKNGNILLVDDVLTTGATLLSCARVLRQYGVKDVRAITWAGGYNLKILGEKTKNWFYFDEY